MSRSQEKKILERERWSDSSGEGNKMSDCDYWLANTARQAKPYRISFGTYSKRLIENKSAPSSCYKKQMLDWFDSAEVANEAIKTIKMLSRILVGAQEEC